MVNDYMSDELFEELLESVREGGAILRGEKRLPEPLWWMSLM
jgi:hypothetical protein